MPITTVGVVSAVTPSVVETYISHYFNRGPLKAKPTAHISYHEGLRLVRQFLDYSSKHAVEDLQAFTAQWVPAPTWVKVENVDISTYHLDRAAKLIQAQLRPKGIEQVGGKNWWQWRRPDTPLRAEWIEMKKDAAERKLRPDTHDRAMLYVHGGAYYFGSVDTHRYQMQRHARKLKTRVLAPQYRLAPQFPFPCGLHDCLASYLYLLESYEPSQILVAGDSAGAGMILSMLVILRDQNVALPAGGILLSPWVDLTHSFPSVSGDGVSDYIPPHGFHHKPSLVWPPPNAEDMAGLKGELMNMASAKKSKNNLSSSIDMDAPTGAGEKTPSQGANLSITVDGRKLEIKDQIQLYTTNALLAHPLVSPVQQPSLGGLPPLLIQVGGGELLHDEQVYLAHKAANPQRYIPSDAVMAEYGLNRADITKYPPTYVQLQVWDDLCHVPHTLSFTRPAKYMFRSAAQFGAWALAHAQHKEIEIDDDANSVISDGPDTDTEANGSSLDLHSSPKKRPRTAISDPLGSKSRKTPNGAVGKAGDALPPFRNHMIRQRVDRHGITYPLASPAELPCLSLEPASIGAIKPGPVRKWLARKAETDSRFANEKKKVQKKRLKEMAAGYEKFPDDTPPPTALAGRRRHDMPTEKRAKKSWALALWSGWGSNHDEATLERSEKMEQIPQAHTMQDDVSVVEDAGQTEGHQGVARSDFLAPQSSRKSTRRISNVSGLSLPISEYGNRPRSAYRRVSDTGQADELPALPTAPVSRQPVAETPAAAAAASAAAVVSPMSPSDDFPSDRAFARRSEVPTMADVAAESTKVDGSDNTFTAPGSNRPHNGTSAYPFKIRNPLSSTSTATLDGDGDSVGAGTTTTRSTPAASLAPAESIIAEKEVFIPSYEKEVVVGSASSPYQNGSRPHPERMPSELAADSPQGAQASQPSLHSGLRPDTYSPSAAHLHPNASSASISPSPAETYRPDHNRVRNPAFDQTGAANSKFGPANGATQNPIQPMGPPKPVGSAYNPRDLRNAMIHRQAFENAAAVTGSHYQQAPPRQTHQQTTMSPTSASPAMSTIPAGFHVAPVELPAIPYSPADGNEASVEHRTPAVSVNLSDHPIELSTVKQTRVSILPPPRSQPPPTPTLELSAVKQTRNSILPAPREILARQTSANASPVISQSASQPESPTFRPSMASSDDSNTSRPSSNGEAEIKDNVTMPVVEQRRPVPAALKLAALADADAVPPTPPPKDSKFTKPLNGPGRNAVNGSMSHENRQDIPAQESSDELSEDEVSVVSDDEPLRARTDSKPPVIGDLGLGGSLGLGADELRGEDQARLQ